jgi:HlyD family secretion protein
MEIKDFNIMHRSIHSTFVIGLLSLLVTGCSKHESASSQESVYSQQVEQVRVEVETVKRQAIAADQEFTGNLLPRRMTRIMSEVSGVVKLIPQTGAKFDVTLNGQRYSEQLGITYGQSVKEGDLLIQLEPRDFEIELQIAQAKLAKARADFAKLQAWERAEEIERLAAMRNEVVARLEQSERNLARMEKLLPKRAISDAEYEQGLMEVSTAKAMVQSAEASLGSAQAGPTVEEVAVQQALVAQAEAEVEQKERQLAKTTIRAPYDGVITAIHVEVGEHVSASGEPLVELMNLRYLIAEIGVPEAYVGLLKVNDEANVHAAGSKEAVPGLIVAINEMVDPSTRTFRVRVAIDNAIVQFKAGQFATVQLRLASNEASLVVPSRSLVYLEGEPHVFILEGNRVHQRAVQPGVTNDGMVELLGGVKLEEKVVVDDPSFLTEGMEVVVSSPVQKVAGDLVNRSPL